MRLVGKSLVVIFAMIGIMASVQHLRGQSTSPLDEAIPVHIGIMVNDIDATTKLFGEVFGIFYVCKVLHFKNFNNIKSK